MEHGSNLRDWYCCVLQADNLRPALEELVCNAEKILKETGRSSKVEVVIPTYHLNPEP